MKKTHKREEWICPVPEVTAEVVAVPEAAAPAVSVEVPWAEDPEARWEDVPWVGCIMVRIMVPGVVCPMVIWVPVLAVTDLLHPRWVAAGIADPIGADAVAAAAAR